MVLTRRRTGPNPDDGAATTATGTPTPAKARARRQADALADLTMAEAEARLVLDWTAPLRHPTFYKAAYRPAVLRAKKLDPAAKMRRISRSTRAATLTRVCVWRLGFGRSTSPRSWATGTLRPR